MTDEKTTLDENVENEDTTTQVENADSEDSEDLDSLFEESDDSDKTTVSREEYEKLLKGTQKLATELGNLKKQKVETKKKDEVVVEKQQPQFAEELLTIKYPEAEFVMEEIQEEAKRTGKDVLSIFKSSAFLKNESKARAEQKKVEEENKSRIDSPSSLTGSKINLKYEQVDLSNPQHVKWINEKQERRDAYAKYLKSKL